MWAVFWYTYSIASAKESDKTNIHMSMHPSVETIKNALESGVHPRLTSASRSEKQAWIGGVLRECSYADLDRDDRGIVRAYIQAVTGYSRAQMARYVSVHAGPTLPAHEEPRPRSRGRLVAVSVLALLLLFLGARRFVGVSPLAFLTAPSIAPLVDSGQQPSTVIVRSVTDADEPRVLFAVAPVAQTKKVLSAVRAAPAAVSVPPVVTTIRDRVVARRDARLLIGSRGENFVSAVSPTGNSLVEMLGVGNDGQVLTYSKGRFVWAFPNFSGTARLPTQSGSTRRYGGGGAPSQPTASVVTNTYNTYVTGSGSGLGTFVGTTSVTSYTGELTSGADTGYEAANALCAAEFAGSHLCMTDEILTTIQTEDISTLFSGVADAWIAEGPPGFTANSNDCAGWTSASSAYLGPWWEFDATGGGIGYLTNCATTKPLACCN